MKIKVQGWIYFVGQIEKLEGGSYKQNVCIRQPVRTDDMGDVISKEQYYPFEIWSKNLNDNKFFPLKSQGKVVVEGWLGGRKWQPKEKEGRLPDEQFFLSIGLSKWELKELHQAVDRKKKDDPEQQENFDFNKD
jgi:hypothetical protein